MKTIAVSPGGLKHEYLVSYLKEAGFAAFISENAEADYRISPGDDRGYAYLKSRRFKEKNGVLTAECALAVAIDNTDFSLGGEEVCVLGAGCIGRPLSSLLRAVGAKVTLLSRGDFPVQKGGFSVIFNTVPAEIWDEEADRLSEGALKIDLSSLPGGIPDRFSPLRALGLPGKYCPKSAAKLIFDCFMKEADL